jgi:2-keto-3-deoxy-L-rhamnonate aldolase RhmA
MNNILLNKFNKGEKSMGTFSHLLSSVAVECLGCAGLDYVVLDLEHSPLTPEGANLLITAARSAGLAPIVRVDEISRSPILKMLDSGAQAVIVPRVETMREVEDLVSYAKFAPLGSRGFCPSRDDGWGLAEHAQRGLEEYMQTSNREAMLIIQCETLGCMENIEKVAATEGVDGILIGPFDLSIAMGKPAQFDDCEVKAAFTRILRACQEAGKLAMIFASNAREAGDYLHQGFDSVAVGLDTVVYINAYREIVKGSGIR